MSAGGVVFDRPASFSELYRFADERLYTAKDSGRDLCEFTVLDITGHARGDPLH